LQSASMHFRLENFRHNSVVAVKKFSFVWDFHGTGGIGRNLHLHYRVAVVAHQTWEDKRAATLSLTVLRVTGPVPGTTCARVSSSTWSDSSEVLQQQ
jgi:hypothetical protein